MCLTIELMRELKNFRLKKQVVLGKRCRNGPPNVGEKVQNREEVGSEFTVKLNLLEMNEFRGWPTVDV